MHSTTHTDTVPVSVLQKRSLERGSYSDSAVNLDAKAAFTAQPVELITRVLGLLDAKSVSLVSQTCRLLFSIATQDLLWKNLCKQRWADKKHAPLKLHPFVDYTHLLTKLDWQEKVDILERRFDNASQPSLLQPGPPSMDEDEDMVLAERVLQSTLVGVADVALFEPKLCGKWQASYIAAELDQHRTRITMNELNAYVWSYQESWGYFGTGDDLGHSLKVRFFPNGMRANAIEDGTARRPRPMPYSFTASGAIQVGQYPTHSKPRRVANWGWEFSNSYVTYKSL
ncbi:hypothetical protein CcCBS67573_g06222 [Chytriomyces confervae]|uniref:F-box domain-containing protein n=1 Tax=Chytriomyces confervae TaxID=246404 RepID=A0A507F5C1_9FUNG|nr:hypothetical protein CcCBS67573_g06222 [Chytriomyces confervae]